MTVPQSGDDRKQWAHAVAKLVRNLVRAGYSGEELSSRIGAAKHKTTPEIAEMARLAGVEADKE